MTSTPKESIEELICPTTGMLFRKDSSGPIFCKPKLIPLKSVTLEKLEMMQQEGLEKMQQIEKQKLEEAKRMNEEDMADNADAEANVPKHTDVWQAD